MRAFEEEGDERYRHAAVRAADWLIEFMDEDGCWRKFGSPMTGKHVNTYNTRAAWSLARVHDITGDRRYLNAAVKNAEWAMTQRNALGWLAENCLQDSTQPFTHTIAYAMRGLLEIGAASGREDFISAARVIGDAMLAALPTNGRLPGRFNDKWQPTVNWSCLTGDCQLGINWGRLYKISGDKKYQEATGRILSFVKRTQKLACENKDILGGVKGSYPINGGYHPWQYPNWATKFYADALMMDIANASGNPYRLTGQLSRDD
ncbi:MAG: hypothetical protein IPP85_15340 [Propionivibrio sp.]|nr:hypothetical protein [Propionivibrio sp.]